MISGVKCIILGGNGFIGSNLTKMVNQEDTIVIGRSLPAAVNNESKYFSIQQYSLREIKEGLTGKADYLVFDLSYNSISNTNPVHPGKDFSENLNLVIDNLHFAKSINARKYVYLSSGGTVYGNATQDLISESHPTNPASHYGIIKLAAEKYIQMYCRQNDMPYHIVRPSNVYGPGQLPFRGQGIVSTAMASIMKSKPFTVYGRGENIRDYIYVDDFCNWLIKLAESGENGEIYNAGSGRGYSVLQILEKIDAELDVQNVLQINHLPERPFDVRLNVLDNRKIVQNTKINPVTKLGEGIRKTWEWLKQDDYYR